MRHSLSCLSFLFIALVSCQKDRIATVIPNHVDRMEDLVAPEGFTYNMFEDHSFSLKVNGPAYYGRVKVLVYGLSEGRRDLIFETMQVVNDTAVIEFPAGQLYQSFAAEAFFGNGQHAVGAWSKNALYAEIGVLDQRKPEHFTSIHKAAGSDCSTCDTVLTSGSSFTVPANGTLCLGAGMSGYTVTVGDGGHLKICGTHIGVDHIYLGVGATISISDGASLTFANGKGLHFGENSSALVHQGGIFTSMGALQWDQGASLVSYGTVYVDGHVNLSKGANLTNFGTFAAKGHIEVEGAGTELLNYGLLYNVSNDHIRVADTAKIINHCHLHSDQHIWIDTYAELINNNQIDCDHRLKIYDEGLLTLGSTSIAVSQDLELKGGLVKSSGVSTAVLKITHDALYFGNARVQGNVDLCIGGLNQNTEN
ncbi:MAG: hypothetical protein RLZZ599_1189, partial [Bacteroidota bacterium]